MYIVSKNVYSQHVLEYWRVFSDQWNYPNVKSGWSIWMVETCVPILCTLICPHVSAVLKPRLHDTTCCQTGLTTSCIVCTAGCQTGCTTRFDNWLNEQWLFVQYSCQTGLTTGWMFVYTIQPVVKRFDNYLYHVNGVLQITALCLNWVQFACVRISFAFVFV